MSSVLFTIPANGRPCDECPQLGGRICRLPRLSPRPDQPRNKSPSGESWNVAASALPVSGFHCVTTRLQVVGRRASQSVEKVALQARPSHCGRRQDARPTRIPGFGEGAQRRISAIGAGRSPDGLFQRAGMAAGNACGRLMKHSKTGGSRCLAQFEARLVWRLPQP